MRSYVFASFAIVLAACSPPASSTGDSSSTNAAQAPAGAQSAALAPQMRLGRWNKVITAMGQQTREAECVTNTDLNQMATEPNSHCVSANGFQRTAEGLVYEAECTGEDGGGHIRTVMSGDMQNRYVADMTMTGAGMSGGMQIRVEGTYEGPCRGDE
ncbi:MAG: DUF3617 family protein [Hyphomonadaceae bacterium]|nr:DUF3617 family protein [Hyphomonadaceae bacterium]